LNKRRNLFLDWVVLERQATGQYLSVGIVCARPARQKNEVGVLKIATNKFNTQLYVISGLNLTEHRSISRCASSEHSRFFHVSTKQHKETSFHSFFH
jgi:hypothetical protein